MWIQSSTAAVIINDVVEQLASLFNRLLPWWQYWEQVQKSFCILLLDVQKTTTKNKVCIYCVQMLINKKYGKVEKLHSSIFFRLSVFVWMFDQKWVWSW